MSDFAIGRRVQPIGDALRDWSNLTSTSTGHVVNIDPRDGWRLVEWDHGGSTFHPVGELRGATRVSLIKDPLLVQASAIASLVRRGEVHVFGRDHRTVEFNVLTSFCGRPITQPLVYTD
jgi:hypothetical protein